MIDCLEGKQGNYILPFLWLHGEEGCVLRSYMGAIDSAGIKAVCLESRPHPDFLGNAWWRDLDIILDEARKRKMKVWLLDDKHFPTGQAGGAMETAPLALQKRYLGCSMADVCGPQKGVSISIEKMLRTSGFPLHTEKNLYDDDELFAVLACKLDGDIDRSLEHIDGDAVNLTEMVHSGSLAWNVPAGMWRIFAFYKTHNGGSPHYVDLTSRDSVKILLDTVYEPHYRRYAADFGKTIAGFFSDEPGLGNISGNSFDSFIGRKRMNLPWSTELEAALGSGIVNELPALWCEYGSKEDTARIRCTYMDALTKLVQTNFSEQIGTWCTEHGVEYIGHIIEDNNAAEGLGCSTGHYFRTLWGQSMAGIDDIGAQITMGGANVEHLSFAGSWDGEFFHHVLGKLGSSLAHIDPKKKDHCVCECFGAYGWQEGTQMMKYIADHLLADGVNHFVPHAFSAKAFPDMDCPPHFYAGGEDILYPAFRKLMGYMNRMCHILNDYRHTASVAILYQAEMVWSGGRYMKMQKVARVLREHQIDFDILPSDVLKDSADMLSVNGRNYDVLLVPGCEVLPEKIMKLLWKAKYAVYFVGFAPDGMDAVPLKELPYLLDDRAEVKLSETHNGIRVYHGKKEDSEVYFLFNSSAWESFEGSVDIGADYRYDAMENVLYQFDGRIRIDPCESVLLIKTKEMLSGKKELSEPTNSIRVEVERLTCTRRNEILHYEMNMEIPAERLLLKLPRVHEVATVYCNGQLIGTKVAKPFVFELSDSWKHGVNNLAIDITPTMEQKVLKASNGTDLFTSMQKVWPQYGLPDGIEILYERNCEKQ